MQQWSQQFDVPLLSADARSTRFKQLVLNPTQLTTVQEAQALARAHRLDPHRRWSRASRQLDVRATVDSARALADAAGRDRSRRSSGLDGTRQAIQSVQQTLKQLDAAKQRVDGAGAEHPQGGASSSARACSAWTRRGKQDYAFARSLLKLPSFSAPDIGNAFFGKVSIDRFQQALYWAELAQHYMPPGLLPRQTPGPKRLRAAGDNDRVPQGTRVGRRSCCSWASSTFAIGGTACSGRLRGHGSGPHLGPALYGKPMVVTRQARRAGIGHRRPRRRRDHRPSDAPRARLVTRPGSAGVKLPSFDLPGLPFRVAPGTGAASLTFALRGDRLSGRWSIGSNQVSWALDSAGGR